VAVLAAAAGLYLAVKADLGNEVDKGLKARASLFMTPPPGAAAGGPVEGRGGAEGPTGSPPGLFGAPSAGPARGRDGGVGLPRSVQPAPFGGASGYVQFVEPSGQVHVPGGQGNESKQIPTNASDLAIARTGEGSVLSDRTVRGAELRVLTEGLGRSGVGRGGAVMVARPLNEVNSELSRLLLILAAVGLAGIALALALGALVAKVALAPVRRFTARTETLTEEGALADLRSVGPSLDLTKRLDVEGRDELARLAESFNRTLDALEQSVITQRQLVADAGHELRTPIASLRANIQTLSEAERLPPADLDSLKADILAELDELTSLVADVVELARGAGPDRGVQEGEVRLDQVVSSAIAKVARRGNVRIDQRLEPTVVTGAGERIERVVSNLLENARKWSPPDGVVEVELRDGVLKVRDHGPGFEDADLAHVFDRFYRADGARALPGSGLGLAIVKQAAESCGGYAKAGNAPDGGAVLEVSFGPQTAFSAPPSGG
ncbi:MAG TPA: ATP-binding protein, partial [Solirubrobacteraceae bacterium]|nr:ATP-binding protein [Solirubrobacteraceae bacterium]